MLRHQTGGALLMLLGVLTQRGAGVATGAASRARVKRAETTSSIGAGVLGAGLSLLLPTDLRTYALPILAIGLAMHAWGMYDKHRLERVGGSARLWWAELLYWFCWVALAALVTYLLVQRLRG